MITLTFNLNQIFQNSWARLLHASVLKQSAYEVESMKNQVILFVTQSEILVLDMQILVDFFPSCSFYRAKMLSTV